MNQHPQQLIPTSRAVASILHDTRWRYPWRRQRSELPRRQPRCRHSASGSSLAVAGMAAEVPSCDSEAAVHGLEEASRDWVGFDGGVVSVLKPAARGLARRALRCLALCVVSKLLWQAATMNTFLRRRLDIFARFTMARGMTLAMLFVLVVARGRSQVRLPMRIHGLQRSPECSHG